MHVKWSVFLGDAPYLHFARCTNNYATILPPLQPRTTSGAVPTITTFYCLTCTVPSWDNWSRVFHCKLWSALWLIYIYHILHSRCTLRMYKTSVDSCECLMNCVSSGRNRKPSSSLISNHYVGMIPKLFRPKLNKMELEKEDSTEWYDISSKFPKALGHSKFQKKHHLD